MTHLYNCRHAGDQYRITKFDEAMNVESSYLTDGKACDCPAGVRKTCRHREMLPKFIQREHIGDEWFLDFDRGGWVQMGEEWLQPKAGPTPTIATMITLPDDSTPEQVAEAFGSIIAEVPAPTKPANVYIRRRL